MPVALKAPVKKQDEWNEFVIKPDLADTFKAIAQSNKLGQKVRQYAKNTTIV